jgi:hypothetical protein
VRRSAVEQAGTAEPDVDPSRAITIRNVALAVLGAAVLVLKSAYDGPFQDVVHSYASNVAVSFALYFAVVNATARCGRPRLVAASLTFLAVATFEATSGFGVMENVYDPADFIADAAGVGLAVIVDITTGRILQRRREQSSPRS